jgi:DNA-binding response OmpR family regulator
VTPQRQADPEEPSQPLRVLIVDDDRDTLLTLGLLLREAGMYVHLLRLGARVMEVVASFRPEVVVLDLVLPDRSGLEVAEEIVLHYGDERPILIAITAHSSDTDRRLAKAAGFEDFISKPYDPQTLLRRLAALRSRG